MGKITLINISKIKENTIVEDNVNEDLIVNTLLEVQDLELQPVIGKILLKRLQSEVEQTVITSGYTLSTPDKILIEEYIEPVLIYGTLVSMFLSAHFKFTNKGIVKKTDTQAQTASTSELELMRSHYSGKFENYKKRLIDYLKVDEDPLTNPEPDQDTTYQSTGWLMNDDDCDYRDYLANKAYKTGYRGRY